MRHILFLAIFLLSVHPFVVFAQEPTDSDLDVVQFLIEYDHEGQCDSVGWSLLYDEFDDETMDVLHFGACQFELDVVLMGGCIDPYPFVEDSQFTEQEPGEITVMCLLRFSVPDGIPMGFDLDPADIYLYTQDGERYQADTYAMSLWPNDLAMVKQRIEGQTDTVNGVGFTIPEGLELPYVIGWRPAEFDKPFPLSIVVDRTIPWPDSDG